MECSEEFHNLTVSKKERFTESEKRTEWNGMKYDQRVAHAYKESGEGQKIKHLHGLLWDILHYVKMYCCGWCNKN